MKSFNPIDAIRHPLWWLMLVVLVVNDFVLKGSGLLPSIITGKLSDFAGLMVFPLLLAILIPWRNRRVWAGTHIATGLAFCAIKLIPAAGSLYVAILNALSLSGQIWFDPTDLVALPMLIVSYTVYPRLRPLVSALRRDRLVPAAAILVASFASIASGTAPPPRTLTSFDGNLMISDVSFINATDTPIIVKVEKLNPHVAVDCNKPIDAEMFKDDQFSTIGTWTQKPGEAASVLPNNSRPDATCFVVKLSIDNVEPVLISWDTRKVAPANVPIKFDLPITPENLAHNAIVLHRNQKNYYLLAKGDFTLAHWRKSLFAVDYWKM